MANSTTASGGDGGPVGALIPSVDPIRLNPNVVEQLLVHNVTIIHVLRVMDGGSHDPAVLKMVKKGEGLENRFRELGFSVVSHPCLPFHRTGTARTTNPNYVMDDSWGLFRAAVDVIKDHRDEIRVIVSGGDKILHGSLDSVAVCTGRTLIDLVGRVYEPLVHPRSCVVEGVPTLTPPNGPFFSETETRTMMSLLRHHRTLNSGIPSSTSEDNGDHGWMETNHLEAGIHSKGLASAIERLCTSEDEHGPLIRERELTSSAKKAIQLTPRGVVQAMMCLNRPAIPHAESTSDASLILDPIHITGLMVPPEVVEASVEDSMARKRVREKLERQGTSASGRVIVATMRGVPEIQGWVVEWAGCHAGFTSTHDELMESVESLRTKVADLIHEGVGAATSQVEIILVIYPPNHQDSRFMNVLRHRLMDAVQKSQESCVGMLGRLNPEGPVVVPVCTDLTGMDSSIASIVSTTSISLGWTMHVTKLARTGSGASQTHVPRGSDRIFELPNREVLHWLWVPRNDKNQAYWQRQKKVLLLFWRAQSTSEAIQLSLSDLKRHLELGSRPDRLFDDEEKGLCPYGLIERCGSREFRLTRKGQHVAAMLDIMERA